MFSKLCLESCVILILHMHPTYKIFEILRLAFSELKIKKLNKIEILIGQLEKNGIGILVMAVLLQQEIQLILIML